MVGPSARSDYLIFARFGGVASNCTECGRCEERCPLGLPIRKYLQAVTGLPGATVDEMAGTSNSQEVSGDPRGYIHLGSHD
jgi:ferredoxin